MPSWVLYIGVGLLGFSLGAIVVCYLDNAYLDKLEGQRLQARAERNALREENERLHQHIAETGDFKAAG